MANCRLVDAGKRPQERCLARSVVAYQANPRAFFSLEQNPVNRPHHDRAALRRGNCAADLRVAARHVGDRLKHQEMSERTAAGIVDRKIDVSPLANMFGSLLLAGSALPISEFHKRNQQPELCLNRTFTAFHESCARSGRQPLHQPIATIKAARSWSFTCGPPAKKDF